MVRSAVSYGSPGEVRALVLETRRTKTASVARFSLVTPGAAIALSTVQRETTTGQCHRHASRPGDGLDTLSAPSDRIVLLLLVLCASLMRPFARLTEPENTVCEDQFLGDGRRIFLKLSRSRRLFRGKSAAILSRTTSETDRHGRQILVEIPRGRPRAPSLRRPFVKGMGFAPITECLDVSGKVTPNTP